MTITIMYSLLSMSMWSRQGARQDWIDNITFIAKECKRIRNILNKYGLPLSTAPPLMSTRSVRIF